MLKTIPNEDFMQLLELTIKMYEAISPNVNAFQATNTLIHLIKMKDFTAVGHYEDDVLLAFTFGFAENEKTFHFSGIYTSIKNSQKLQELIDFSFDNIKELGYTGWQVDATNPNISSIMEKYGAKPLYTRYAKEFD